MDIFKCVSATSGCISPIDFRRELRHCDSWQKDSLIFPYEFFALAKHVLAKILKLIENFYKIEFFVRSGYRPRAIKMRVGTHRVRKTVAM